jgi:hypothetical protein
MMKLTYSEEKDVELWVLSGAAWSVPMRLRHCVLDGKEMAHVVPAVPIGFAQYGVVEPKLRFHNGTPLRSGWLLELSDFTAASTKAAGITPEFYYKWNGELCEKPNAPESETVDWSKKKRLDVQNEFIDLVADRSGLDRSNLTLCWMAISQCMADWLLSGRMIDFGLFRLQAFPYRRNWKEVLLARYPQLKKICFVKDRKRLMSLAFTAASRMIRSSELTEYRSRMNRALFGWTIEVIHDSSWENAAAEAEHECAASLGPIAYLKRWATKISHLEEQIYDVIREYAAKENTSCCRLYWRRNQGGARFAQGAPTLISYRASLDGDGVGDQSVDDLLGVEDTSAYLEEAAARLLAVSDAEPDVDLRIPGGDNDRAEREAADSGLLVLPAIGGKAAREDVLDGRDGNQGG